jgi:solute carrier family 25 (mitochondrial phosphate transporter), member 23/24/25/41
MSKDFLIGGTAAIVSRTATAPLELARLQIQNNYLKHNSISHVLQNEGVRHLWKGNWTNCIRIFPQYAMNFMLYEKFQKKIKPFFHDDNYVHLLSGGASGIISIMSIYPLETARSHLALQINHSKYSGLTDVFKQLSLRELYAGSKLTCFGYGPWNAINFASYNYYKTNFKSYEENTPHLFKLLCGGMAGMTAISITYPTDLIRRRLQMQSFSPEVPRYDGILDCIQKIFGKEGFVGFYRGLSISYIKTFPTLAIQFYTLDTLKDFFMKY